MGGLSEQVWKAVDEFVDRAAVRRYGDGFLDRSRCDRIVLPAVERILAAHNGGLAERIRDYADDMEHQRSCEWDCPTEIAQELRALAPQPAAASRHTCTRCGGPLGDAFDSDDHICPQPAATEEGVGNGALPLHRTEAGWPRCSTCDGGGCPDCTDPA